MRVEYEDRQAWHWQAEAVQATSQFELCYKKGDVQLELLTILRTPVSPRLLASSTSRSTANSSTTKAP
jgi:hypothetical protein